jgi:L-ribulose-5-phosphate 4-epimerase
MNLAEERRRLIAVARSLRARGLVARTWGNLSVRIDGGRILITPSGRTYETMGAEDLAIVSLAGGRWEGPFKPSSERELHARIYRRRPEIGAVIHTHQPAASSLAAARKGFTPASPTDRELLGGTVPCVRYALPTTRRLAGFVEGAVAGSSSRALLLSNHGALCLGSTIEEALQVSVALEEIADKEIVSHFRNGATREELLEHYAPASSTAEVDAATEMNLLEELRAHHPGKSFMVHKGAYLCAAARAGQTIFPMVDDQAQLIGPTLPVVYLTKPSASVKVRRILEHRNAVLVPGLGGVCRGDDASEVEAAAMVAEKGCRVVIESSYLGGGHRISRPETYLMRFIFLAKYRKKAVG